MNSKTKKTLGWIILIIAIFIINPLPGADDLVTLQAYSMYSGADVSLNNISVIYVDYLIWCFVVGFILLFFGMYLLGWDFKKLLNYLNFGKYKMAIFLAIAAVLFVAVFDIWSMNSGVFGSVLDYTLGNYTVGWWDLFYKFVLSFFVVVPVCYFFLVRKDFSEALGIFGASMILYFGGLADIAYFIFQRIPIPKTLPWLDNHLIIGWISNTLGFAGVTNVSLIISVFISVIVMLLYVKVLKERF